MDTVQFFYGLFSIVVVAFVITFGVAWKSNYIPPRQREKDEGNLHTASTKTKAKVKAEGGESDVSTH